MDKTQPTLTVFNDAGDAHVLPVHEHEDHTTTNLCRCNFTIEAHERPDGKIVFLIEHDSINK